MAAAAVKKKKFETATHGWAGTPHHPYDIRPLYVTRGCRRRAGIIVSHVYKKVGRVYERNAQ